MVKWRLERGHLTVTESSLLVPEFKALFDINIDYLKYVFLKCDISEENPLRSLTEGDRNLKAIEMTIGTTALPQEHKVLINRACEAYAELNKTSAFRFLKTIDDQLDRINALLKTVSPKIEEGQDRNGNVVYSTNADIIIKLMEKVDTIQSKRESIEKRSSKEAAKTKAKGNQERSSLTKGLIRPPQI